MESLREEQRKLHRQISVAFFFLRSLRTTKGQSAIERKTTYIIVRSWGKLYKKNLDFSSNSWLQKPSLTEHKEKSWPFPDKYQRKQECSRTNSNIYFHTLLRVLRIEAELALFLLGQKTDTKSSCRMWSVWSLLSQTLPVRVKKDFESTPTRTANICADAEVCLAQHFPTFARRGFGCCQGM